LLHKKFNKLPIIVMTDYGFEDAERKVQEMGYRVIMKPRRAEIGDMEKVQLFMARLVDDIAKFVQRI